MNKISPLGLILLITVILSSIVVFLLASLECSLSGIFYRTLIFLCLCFGSLYLFIQRYLYEKVSNLYKIIFPMKESQIKDSILKSEKIDEVSAEIVEYTKLRKEEIENMKMREVYQKEFIGNLAHELKTPTFNIQGYILTLLEGGLDDPKINTKYLQRAEKSTDRMIQILEDLDTMSKFDYDRIALRIESVALEELVSEVLDEFALKIKNEQIDLIVNIPKDLKVSIDKKRIKQVFINLINNSIKYGNDQGRIEISASLFNNKTLVNISDNGPGIAKKHMQRLFERFYRVEESRSRDLGGSGLGLAIVKSIIEKHEQTINVVSKINKGTTFTFTLETSKQ